MEDHEKKPTRKPRMQLAGCVGESTTYLADDGSMKPRNMVGHPSKNTTADETVATTQPMEHQANADGE
jgi:hypothetical protein